MVEVFFEPKGQGVASGLGFFGIELIDSLELVVGKVLDISTLVELKVFDQEGPNFQGSHCDILPEDLLENMVFFIKVNNVLPIPLCIHKLAIFHISTQGLFGDAGKGGSPGVESSQKR